MLSVCFVLFVYRCELAILESAQLGSSGAARTCTLATVSVQLLQLATSASMMSNINILRHKIELTNFNEIEKSSERSIQAHMRTFVVRTFQCNLNVLFHTPINKPMQRISYIKIPVYRSRRTKFYMSLNGRAPSLTTLSL